MNITRHIHALMPAVATALLTASCSSDEPQQPYEPTEAIAFATPKVSFTGAAASRSEMLSGTLSEGCEFKVFGYCVPYTTAGGSVNINPDYEAASSAFNSKLAFVHPDVFSGKSVIVTVTGDGCVYTPLQPWYNKGSNSVPLTADTDQFRYSFLAFYPANRFENARTETAPADRGIPRLIFTMPFDAGGDAGTSRDHTAIADAMYAGQFNALKSGGRVGLTFHHLLAGFSFRVYNHNTAGTLVIDRLTLSGSFIRSTALEFPSSVLSQMTTTAGSDRFAGTFSLLDRAMQVPGTSGLIVGNSSGEETTVLLLPDAKASSPKTALGENLRLDIGYHYVDASGAAMEQKSAQLEFEPKGIPLGGTRYTANLNFVGNNFVLIFQDETDRWENGSNNDIIIQ